MKKIIFFYPGSKIMKKYFQGCAVNKYVNITSVFTIYEKIFEDTYYFDGESHDFWEFVCVLDGSLGVTAGEDVCILERGQSVLHRPSYLCDLFCRGCYASDKRKAVSVDRRRIQHHIRPYGKSGQHF